MNLGGNTLGGKLAARRYFNKEVSDLTLAECTGLSSITSNPSRYNPITNPENNNTRRQIVLQNMVDQNYISKQDMENALSDDVYDRIQNVNTATKETNSHYSYFTMRSGGQTTVTFLFDSVYTWVVMIPYAFVRSRFTTLSITMVFFLVSFTEIIKVIIGFFMIKSNVWLQNIVNSY